jgi:phosphonoacetaldehyde hydrolase
MQMIALFALRHGSIHRIVTAFNLAFPQEKVYPMAAIAKIGDTPADVQEGLNTGAWSIGVAGTGNMVGLSFDDFNALSDADKQSRLASARAELQSAGAHYVIDSLNQADSVLDDIDARLKSAAGSYSRTNE